MTFPSVTGSAILGAPPVINVPARTAGNMVILAATMTTTTGVGSKIPTVSALAGTSWNLLGSTTGSSASVRYWAIFYLVAGSSGIAEDVTITPPTNWSAARAWSAVISGNHITTPPEMTTTTGIDPPALSIAGWGLEDTLWIATAARFGSGPTGTGAYTSFVTDDQLIAGYYRSTPEVAGDPPTFTGGSGNGSAATIAIRTAGAPVANTSRLLQFF